VAALVRRSLLFSPVDMLQREALLKDYLGFLRVRNGPLLASGRYANRERSLEQMQSSDVRFEGTFDQALFDRLYEGRASSEEVTLGRLVLVAFTRINAAEAYGVNVVSDVRKFQSDSSDLMHQVQHVLHNEEHYHTRILVGSTCHYGVAAPDAFVPPLPLKILIHSLAHSPKMWFHPILLASEIGGVFMVNWLLERLGQWVDQPDLREALEERLIEILIDEVGHVAFNRLAVGDVGLEVGRRLAPIVASSMPAITPELKSLGFDEAVRHMGDFDIDRLPRDVLDRAFYT
jgi:hypothetical protein